MKYIIGVDQNKSIALHDTNGITLIKGAAPKLVQDSSKLQMLIAKGVVKEIAEKEAIAILKSFGMWQGAGDSKQEVVAPVQEVVAPVQEANEKPNLKAMSIDELRTFLESNFPEASEEIKAYGKVQLREWIEANLAE